MIIEEEKLKERLVELRMSGAGTGHNRFVNLKNIERLIKKDPYATFGIENLGKLHPSEVLDYIANITGCSHDNRVIDGTGYISPSSTLEGLKEAAKLLASLPKDTDLLIATGHPGSMLSFYSELVRFLSTRHNILVSRERVEVKKERCPDCGQHDVVEWIDYIEGVAMVTNGDEMVHMHYSEPMAKLLDSLPSVPKIVIADHGFAGEAINRGVKTITVMDTNDPVIAVAKAKGRDVIIIPMDDNQGNYSSGQVGQMLVGFMLNYSDENRNSGPA